MRSPGSLASPHSDVPFGRSRDMLVMAHTGRSGSPMWLYGWDDRMKEETHIINRARVRYRGPRGAGPYSRVWAVDPELSERELSP